MYKMKIIEWQFTVLCIEQTVCKMNEKAHEVY
jgi:hypothetical protein